MTTFTPKSAEILKRDVVILAWALYFYKRERARVTDGRQQQRQQQRNVTQLTLAGFSRLMHHRCRLVIVIILILIINKHVHTEKSEWETERTE